MATFAISRSANGLSASVDGADVGREVDAAKFNTPTSFGKEVTGLSRTFGDAVNDAQINARDMTAPAAKAPSLKVQDFGA